MELTQKTVRERLEWLGKLAADQPEDFANLAGGMHEKGVECAVIIPLVEVLLEFDALRDIHYEQVSESRHGQRFDFLLDGRFLIESKSLGANLNDHHAQIARYIRGNDDINYGILSNGVDFQIWLQKSFVESESGNTLPLSSPVALALDLSLLDEGVPFVLDTLSLFKKDTYRDSFATLARVAGYYGGGARGRPPILHQDRAINAQLTEEIKQRMEIKKGVYFTDVVEGKLNPGQQLRFTDGCVEIVVEVTKTGTVRLGRGMANVLDLTQALDRGWGSLVQLIAGKWSQAEVEYDDPIEIVKLGLNRQRLHGKDKYAFERI